MQVCFYEYIPDLSTPAPDPGPFASADMPAVPEKGQKVRVRDGYYEVVEVVWTVDNDRYNDICVFLLSK